MPLIRYTYPPDVRLYGDQPIVVADVEARTLVDDMRRAVRVSEADLAELRKADLLEVAGTAGADVKKSDTKAAIAKTVAESEDT